MPSAIDFSSFYSKKQYEECRQSRGIKNMDSAGAEATKTWRTHVAIYQRSVLAYLYARAEAGDLAPIAFGERRGLPFVESWNRLATKEAPA